MSDKLEQQNRELASLGDDYATKYGFRDPVDYFHKGAKGINHEVVEMITQMKKEPRWMADIRHEALDIFLSKPTPKWGDSNLLNEIDFDNIYYYMKPIEHQETDWDDVIRVNLKSVFNCCRAVTRTMVRQRHGHIINISSISGVVGQAGQANYSASKAGIIGFTKSLAKELGQRGITVNVVAPGFVVTDLTTGLPAELKQKAIDITPLRRMGEPEEIAYAVAFLASDEAAFITGEVLTVDGGLAM